MYHDAFKPGDDVVPGLYWVHHYQHRLAHLCRVLVVQFPACAKCGDKVRFTAATTALDNPAPWLRLDADFFENAKDIPLHTPPAGA